MGYRHCPLYTVWTEPTSTLCLTPSIFFFPVGSFFFPLWVSFLPCTYILQPKITLISLYRSAQWAFFPWYSSKQSSIITQEPLPQLPQHSCCSGLCTPGYHPVCLLWFFFFLIMSFCFRTSCAQVQMNVQAGNFNYCQTQMSVLSSKYSTFADSRKLWRYLIWCIIVSLIEPNFPQA